MRERTGKSARLTGVEFDRGAVNTITEPVAEETAAELPENSDAEDAKAE
jgi:hypothetical protein